MSGEERDSALGYDGGLGKILIPVGGEGEASLIFPVRGNLPPERKSAGEGRLN